MQNIQIECPAKINLTLEIVNKREDGFHNIKSIMQMINLYDYLEINIEESSKNEIILSGNSTEIPYNEKNLVYKASKLFFETTGIKNKKVKIYINKNIPISAGLAGGSTDAAGTIYGLNKLFNSILTKSQLHELCAKLGSDLNVCLEGGCILATSRGEVIEKISTILNSPVTLIKPKYIGISAKEAYTKFALIKDKKNLNMTEKMFNAIKNNQEIKPLLYNDLEKAVFNDYKELQEIKKLLPESIMSGSGSTYFVLEKDIKCKMNDNYQIINNLHFIQDGIKCKDFVMY